MQDTTKDWIAVEMVIITFVAALGFGLSLIMMNVGISLFSSWQSWCVLYGFRWLCWAMEYGRKRTHLQTTLFRFLSATGIVLALGGGTLAVAILVSSSGTGERLPVSVIAGLMFIVGMGLLWWVQERCKPPALASEPTPALGKAS